MSQKNYLLFSGSIFFLAAVFHGYRALMGWSLSYGPILIPSWISWIGLLLGGLLVYSAWKLSKKR